MGMSQFTNKVLLIKTTELDCLPDLEVKNSNEGSSLLFLSLSV